MSTKNSYLAQLLSKCKAAKAIVTSLKIHLILSSAGAGKKCIYSYRSLFFECPQLLIFLS